MNAQAELQILISVGKEAKAVIDKLMKDLAAISTTLGKIDSTATGSEPTKDLGDLDKSADKANESLRKIPENTALVEAGFRKVADGIRFLVGGFLALQSVQIAKSLADTAARSQTLGVVLEQVAINTGVTVTEIRKADKEVQSLGITAAASRQSLTQFLQAGLDVNKAGQLARLAQDAAVIAGSNSSDTFQRLILNIQQMDTMGLRFMGIVINATQAIDKYAAANKVAADSLTQTQRQQAIFNAVLARGVDIAGVYEASMNTVSKQISSLDRLHNNLAVSLGNNLLPAYSAIVKELTEFLKNMAGVAEDLDAQGLAGERFGEKVGAAARGLRIFIETLVEMKDILLFVGTLFVASKIVAWTLAILAAKGAVFSLAGILTGIVGVLGGWVAAIVGLTVALGVWFANTEAGGPILSALGNTLTFIANGAFTVFRLTVLQVVKAWEQLKSTFSTSKEETAAISNTISAIDAEINTLSARLNQRKKEVDAAWTDVLDGPDKSVDVSTLPVEKVTSALREQIKALAELGKAKAKAYEEGRTQDAKELDAQISKLARNKLEYMDQLNKIEKNKDLTEQQRLLIAQVRELEAAPGKMTKAWADWGDIIAKARKDLNVDKFTFTDGKIFSSETSANVKSFAAMYSHELLTLQDQNELTEDSLNRLRKAFEALAKTMTTVDDVKLVKNLLGEISQGGQVAASVLGRMQSDLEVNAKRVNDAARDQYKSLIQDRRQLQKSVFALELQDLTNAQNLELAKLEDAISKQEDTYRRGQLSIANYYNEKRRQIAQSAEFEVNKINQQIKQVDFEIATASKDGLKKTEINGLLKQKAELEGQVAVKVQHTITKIEELNAAQRETERINERLVVTAREAYAEALGDTVGARQSAIQREFEDKVRELRPDSKGYEEQLSLLTKIRDIKLQTNVIEGQSNGLALVRSDIDRRAAELNNGLFLGLISRFEFERRMRALSFERIKLAEQELQILKEQAAVQTADNNLKIKISQKEREIIDLRTQSLNQYRQFADQINKAFENTAANFFEKLMNGTATWKEAFTQALNDLKSELIRLGARNIAEQLFGRPGFFDPGGAITGDRSRGTDRTAEVPSLLGMLTSLPRALFGGSTTTKTDTGNKNISSTAVEIVDTFTGSGKKVFQTALAKQADSTFAGAAATVGKGGGYTSLGSSLSSAIDSLFSSISGLFKGGGDAIGGLFKGLFSFMTPLARADGGVVRGPGTSTSDSIPVWMSDGEFVTKAKQTKKWRPLLEAINSGHLDNLAPMLIPKLPKFADGGLVSASALGAGIPTAASRPTQTTVSLQVHPDAMHMTMRDWLEGELARIAAGGR